MRLDRILHKVLEARKRKLEAASVTVVEEPDPRDVRVEVSSRDLAKVAGEVIEKAVDAMASVPERRLVVRSRRASWGALVEVEYTGVGEEEPAAAARVSHESEEAAARELASYRETLGEWGGKLFIKTVEGCNTRYLIEVPARRRRAKAS